MCMIGLRALTLYVFLTLFAIVYSCNTFVVVLVSVQKTVNGMSQSLEYSIKNVCLICISHTFRNSL